MHLPFLHARRCASRRAHEAARTTAVSGRDVEDRGIPEEFRVARASLLLGFVLISASGCLVTNTPTYPDPDETAPFLTALTPDLRLPIVLDGMKTAEVPIRATVVSEDAGHPVLTRLFVDYGTTSPSGKPFSTVEVGPTLDAAHITDSAREIDLSWTPGLSLTFGCHNIALVASHDFDDKISGCPVDKSKSSILIWTVLRCDNTSMDPACDSIPLNGHPNQDCRPIEMLDACKESNPLDAGTDGAGH
jgi:hypothetical protein